jgi:hypothetical protein
MSTPREDKDLIEIKSHANQETSLIMIVILYNNHSIAYSVDEAKYMFEENQTPKDMHYNGNS